MAMTNGAVSFLAEALAVELTPVPWRSLRTSLAPAWDGMGAGAKRVMSAETAASNQSAASACRTMSCPRCCSLSTTGS